MPAPHCVNTLRILHAAFLSLSLSLSLSRALLCAACVWLLTPLENKICNHPATASMRIVKSNAMSLAAAALLLPAVTAAVPSIGDRLVAGYFKQWSLPLTLSKATEAGWTAVTGDPTACDPVSGRRFRFGELLTPTLAFDKMGSLAGVQIVVNETTYPSYPQSNWRPSNGWFTATGDLPELSSMAIHFKDPAKLCSAEAVDEAGGSIGDRLWLRLPSDDFEQLPLLEEELRAGMPASGWNQGDCLPSNLIYPGSPGMGLHYWRHVGRTSDSACEDAGPVFLMYDEHGVLVNFGILLLGMGRGPTVGGVLPSGSAVAPGDSVFEFPRSTEPFFLKTGTSATCFADLTKWDGTTAGAANLSFIVATVHFALSDTSAITCAPAPPRSPPAPSPPPPPPPPCTNLLEECKDECSKSHIMCKSACANKKKCKKKCKKCKKKCKKDKKKCKNSCESKYKCNTSCEDNTTPGLGTWWCELNMADPNFCRNEAFKNKCKETCGLCHF